MGATFLAADPFPNAKAALDKKIILRIQIILVHLGTELPLVSPKIVLAGHGCTGLSWAHLR